MREIKFRAWVERTKKMVSLDRTFVGELNSLDVPVMQFTGLKDKNGKEIYEGDIVRFFTYNYKNGTLSIVKMSEDGRWLPFNDDDYIQDEQGDWFILEKGFEIIGNIYENPELVKP